MTRQLRQRHRRWIKVIALLLPIAFVLGMVARKMVPTVESLPSAITNVR
jgi:hypothetical protein